MLTNYLKVALRSLSRHKLTAIINILGLGLGMACCILIFLFVQDELSYDRHHSKADRIYRATRSFHSAEGEVNLHLSRVAPPIGPLLKNDFGQIEAVARTINFGIVVGLEENGELKMMNSEQNLFIVEPALFDIMDIPVISGDPAKSLERPFTVMLSKKTALRYFNTTDVIGKRLRANNQFDLDVTGVYEDFPDQSHWHPEFMVSFSTMNDDNVYGRVGLETNWGNNAFGTYLLLQPGADAKTIELQLPDFMNRHFGNFAKTNFGAPPDFEASKVTTLYLQKLTDIHLRSHLDDEIEPNGNINNVYMMSVIGAFIILIACFNFINLSTARATKRGKEVGLRKVAGAFRFQLVTQYLTESVLIAAFALLLAIALSTAGLEWLNGFTNKNLSLTTGLKPSFIGGLVGFAIVIGIIAGVYPAFVLSGFRPAVSLKGAQSGSRASLALRRTLVVAQFAISVILVIATLLTFQQLNYLNNRSLGYNREMVVTLPNFPELNNNFDAFYNEATRSNEILDVSRSSRIPTGRLLDSFGNVRILKDDSLTTSPVSLKTICIDETFFDTYDIRMVTGRNFSKNIVTDDSLAFIINEAAAREFGWENPKDHINEDVQYAGVRGKLVGIVSDFHFESLHQPIVPMIFLNSNRYNVVSVKINSGSRREAIERLEQLWKSFVPSRPFSFQFLSENYQALYDAEQKQSTLFTTFSLLAIFIACLGLLGLATFNATQRIKEIGIRKVLGATIPQILGLLSKETVILILVANAIAWPVAWYFMNEWLNTFAYHININVFVFAIAALLAVLLAIVTVSIQSFRAAAANPAQTLKYE